MFACSKASVGSERGEDGKHFFNTLFLPMKWYLCLRYSLVSSDDMISHLQDSIQVCNIKANVGYDVISTGFIVGWLIILFNWVVLKNPKNS